MFTGRRHGWLRWNCRQCRIGLCRRQHGAENLKCDCCAGDCSGRGLARDDRARPERRLRLVLLGTTAYAAEKTVLAKAELFPIYIQKFNPDPRYLALVAYARARNLSQYSDPHVFAC